MRKILSRDFEKLNLRIGTIIGVKKHPKTDEYVLLIDLGSVEGEKLQLVADIKEGYAMHELMGKQVVVLENIKPITVGGIESQGMLLMTHREGKPVLLTPEKTVHQGIRVFGIRDAEVTHHFKPGVE